ncbi:hypothetical protein [Tropicibacter sp. S64]|uniref:hypothetical protein n=1 Tax=Tropicibacter sp. S64 TaxID=3415122 RepID=UPI003C7C0656
MKERADLGFDDELDGFDPADWTPKAKPKPEPEAREKARELAEATGFRSREPARPAQTPKPKTKPAGQGTRTPAAEKKPPRRRRTGRNAQFNIKTTPETIEAFCAIADARGWGLGETLEHAVLLLQKDKG